MAKGSIPVLVGAGQTVSHWDGSTGLAGAPTYISLGIEAANRALADCGGQGVAAAVDTVAMTRTMDDSIPNYASPLGRCNNLPRAVAAGIGADPAEAIYEISGGQSPQSLVNEMAARIHDGSSEVALIAGTEAIGARKTARKLGLELSFEAQIDGALDDRGLGPRLLNRTEIKHGLVVPAYFYALFENAYAHGQGHERHEHRRAMSELFSGFSDVAADNPYAQFPIARGVDFLATPSRENYPFADPYLKWHMAQDAVNMAAAVLIMSEDKADALGIAQDRRVYLHGGGEASDSHISERPRMDGAWAMEVALGRALEQAGRQAGDMRHLDLYSCFPIAVFSSAAALDIDWRKDERALTQTGGLPYFGGPGNNYSLHGIASMMDTLRADPGSFGLVLANGGWLTKEAAGVYGTERPKRFEPAAALARPDTAVPADPEPSAGTLETFTVVHGREGPGFAVAFIRSESGARCVAQSLASDVFERLGAERSPIGAPMRVTQDGEVNTFRFAT